MPGPHLYLFLEESGILIMAPFQPLQGENVLFLSTNLGLSFETLELPEFDSKPENFEVLDLVADIFDPFSFYLFDSTERAIYINLYPFLHTFVDICEEEDMVPRIPQSCYMGEVR